MSADHNSRAASLVVFSDDWGRHPSSCQHLIGKLLPQYRVLWVNTIGTRAPRADLATMKRVAEKLKQWALRAPSCDGIGAATEHHNLTVANPRMWPWFGRSIDRRLNRWLLSRQLTPLINTLPQPVAAVTTLPITADLPGHLPVRSWLYYCVDDFAAWPGLDGKTLRRMDRQMIHRADAVTAVSAHLQDMMAEHGRDSRLLTHGVDLDYWRLSSESAAVQKLVSGRPTGPLIVFWGVVDRRLDTPMLTTLSQQLRTGSILLVGPQQDPDPHILQLPNVSAPGPLPFKELPALAAAADVLVMPYADLPVTRAMQPLKMKEYMATGKPVVTSQLPAAESWQDCMDVVASAEEFAAAVGRRLAEGLPAAQLAARGRLTQESWSAKARQLEEAISAALMHSRLDKSDQLSLAEQADQPVLLAHNELPHWEQQRP